MINKKKLHKDLNSLGETLLALVSLFGLIGWGISGFGFALVSSYPPEYRGYAALVVLTINITIFGVWAFNRYKV